VPGAPVIGTATAGNESATVSYTAPAAPANGSPPITSYTAKSNDGITSTLTQAGSGVITVNGLTNGTAYTFTVTATNSNDEGAPSAPSNGVRTLTTQVASNNSGGTFTFMSHNLGADTLLDPDTPVKGLNGDYYQWGKNAPDADVDNVIGGAWGNQGGSTAKLNWSSTEKGPNDPCPAGFRVPSQAEWIAVDTYNTASRTGSATWTASATNFGNALHYGSATTPKLLTLPAAGYRRTDQSGGLTARDLLGLYWSSTYRNDAGDNASFYFRFDDDTESPGAASIRSEGLSVRCIAE
jgi:uncharacterized protein (TIGR02145 family)